MTEAKQPDFNDLMKQIEAFEKTVSELAANIGKLKHKLQANKDKYGPDMRSWPKEEY
jgi:hypothetical protein